VIRHFYLLLFIASLVGCGGQSVVKDNVQSIDPVVELVAIAYVKRTSFSVDELVRRDISDITAFQPGSALFYQVGSVGNATIINVSDQAFINADQTVDPYDVKDIETSSDGKFLLFSLRAPQIENVDEDKQPTWNIWQYEIATQTLTRVIMSDILAEQGHDTSPYYLPDGRIVFSSTRQSGNKSILLDEGKPQYEALDDERNQFSSLLHVMNNDGSNIRQISYGQGHDINPIVLNNGKILFSRWEQRSANNGISLYQIDSDGKSLELVYGRHSHEQFDTDVQFIRPREMPDGSILIGIKSIEAASFSTHFVTVDIAQYIDNNQLVDDALPTDIQAQTEVLFGVSPLNDEISLEGQFNSAVPLFDGTDRLIIGWNPCRIVDPSNNTNFLPCSAENILLPDIEAAPPLLGYWLYNRDTDIQTPLVLANEGDFFDEIIALEDKSFPDSTETSAQNAEAISLEINDMAILDIRSVYDLSGIDSANPNLSTLADSSLSVRNDRRAQFLRVIKPVSIPDDNILNFSNRAFGRSSAQSMRDILGYIPIEPDGSVRFKMPANIAFSIEILDEQGMRFSQRHENWLQLAPGEIRECNGCHTAQSRSPHGLINRGVTALNQGALDNGSFAGSNDAFIAQTGETMAQTRSRIAGTSLLSPNLNYVDVWSDVTERVADPSTSLSYDDLVTEKPISDNCQIEWKNNCRVSIHFPVHIQPLLELDRPVFDDSGLVEVAQNSCISCHSPIDNEGVVRVPSGQLDLSSTDSSEVAFFTTSYRELLFNDNEQAVIDGVLLDRLVPQLDNEGNPVFELDEEGELVLDSDEQPIMIFETVNIRSPLSVAGAANSDNFFDLFTSGASHENRLTDAELRLIAEWVDLGAQYYNNPFVIPND